MPQDPVFSGALAGRFYRLGTPLSPDKSLVEAALPQAWEEGLPVVPFLRRFCQGTMPNEGDLGDDSVDLAYHDGGTGFWRLWLREETRKAPKVAIQHRAAKLALELDPDTPLPKMQRSGRVQVMDQAKRELLKEAIPQIRVLPVVVGTEWVWVGRRACVTDRTYIHLLRQVVGDLEPDPLLWSEDGGWSTCSYATLLAFTKVKAGELAPDVHLCEVDVKGRSVQLKASDSADEVRAVLKQLTSAVSETSVRRMSFDVMKDGVRIVVDVDGHGVYRVVPMRSPGGLSHERIARRFGDARYAAARIRTVMEELVARFEEAA